MKTFQKILMVAVTLLTLVFADGISAQSVFPAPIVPVASTNPPNLSMLTNHASMVDWAFKQVGGVAANLWCGVQADNGQNLRMYGYDEHVKSLDRIKEILASDNWWVHVTSVTDYFSINVSFYKTNDWNVVNNDRSMLLFQGWNSALPEKNQYGQWQLPLWATSASMNLASDLWIKIPGVIDARLISRDNYGNPIPRQLGVENDGIWFPSAQAGNGVLVLTFLTYNPQNGYYYYDQKAYSLTDGSETPLTWVYAQILVEGSGDLMTFKNTTLINPFIWDYQGYGTLPLVQAVFTSSTTNVVFSLTTASGQYAKSFDVEDQSTGKKTTFYITPGTTSASAGTNVFKGVYNIIPQGVKLTPWNYGGGKG